VIFLSSDLCLLPLIDGDVERDLQPTTSQAPPTPFPGIENLHLAIERFGLFESVLLHEIAEDELGNAVESFLDGA
jgi:hypothetical protein